MFRFPSLSTSKGWVGRSDKKKIKNIFSKYCNSFRGGGASSLKTFLFSLKFPKICGVGYGTLKKSESVWAMGNETIYWEGLTCAILKLELFKNLWVILENIDLFVVTFWIKTFAAIKDCVSF